jgi:hypothetical protein
MRLYRVEDEDGAGPWRARPFDLRGRIGATSMFDWCEEVGLEGGMHNDTTGFPNPREDGISNAMAGTYLSACRSTAQIDHWFPEPLRQVMRREGFRLAVYEIPESRVYVASKQVAVVGESMCAAPIEILDLVTFQPKETDNA